MRNEKIIRATKGVLDFMFFSGIAVVVTLPWTLKLAGRYYDDTLQEQYIPMLVTLAVSGIFGILIVSQLRKMMETVVNGSCFVYENVKSLRLMTRFSLCITAAFLLEMFFCTHDRGSGDRSDLFCGGAVQPGPVAGLWGSGPL